MEVLRFLSMHRNAFFTVLSFIAKLFGEEFFILAGIGVIFWCVNKRIAYNIGVAFFISSFCAQELKVFVRMPRPWIIDPELTVVKSALKSATGYSFPSAHSQTAASLYGILAFSAKKNCIKLLCFFAVCLTAWSRMYVGVHTPKDVLAGLFIGFMVAYLYDRLVLKKGIEQAVVVPVSIIISILCIAGIFTSLYLCYSEIINYANAKDLLSSTSAGLAFSITYFLDARRYHIEIKGNKKQLVIKVIVGFVTTLIIKASLKMILLPLALVGDSIRYFLMSFWALFIYPLLFNKLIKD